MARRWKLLELTSDLELSLSRRLRLGALVPWANIAMETELPQILPRVTTWHFARLVPGCRTTAIDADFLRGMVEAIPDAMLQLSQIQLDAVGFGCTSAAFSSWDEPEPCLQRSIGPTPFVTAYDAILRLLRFHGARQIALLTPYEEHVTDLEIRALRREGFEVARSLSLRYRDDIGAVESDELMGAARQLSCRDMEALVISCTALHTLEAVPLLEEEFGIPVLSSNTSLALSLVLDHLRQTKNSGEV